MKEIQSMNSFGKIIFVYLSPDDGSYSLRGIPEFRMSRRPQLGFQYLCATLEVEGYQTEILDQTIINFTPDWLVAYLHSKDILFVGFYCADVLIDKLTFYISHIKNTINTLPLVVGGPGTLHSKPYLEAGADLLCLGEGEVTAIEIAEYFRGIRRRDQVKGVCWLQNSTVVYALPQQQIENLDSLPFPLRDKIDMRYYHDYYIYNMQKPYVTMMASRGCAYRCSFCTSHEIWQHKVRFRSPENVVAEIDDIVARYGIRYIAFQDDIFALNEKWLRRFNELMKGRHPNLRWMCILHPLSFRSKRGEMMDLLKEAGCDCISMGLQSADANILTNVCRGPREPDLAKELIKEAKKRSMLTSMGYIFGLPGDTSETISKTISYVMECKPHHAEFYTLTVLKGSQIDRDFKNTPVTQLNYRELREWARKASARFYSHPATIWRNICYVLRHKPSWLLIAIRFLPNLLTVVGIFGQRANKNTENHNKDSGAHI